MAFAAAQLKALGNPAVMGKVDAVSTPGGQALAVRFNVTGFPALIWFVNGQPQLFLGLPRDRSDLVFWVASTTNDVTIALSDQVCDLSPAFQECATKHAHRTQRLLFDG